MSSILLLENKDTPKNLIDCAFVKLSTMKLKAKKGLEGEINKIIKDLEKQALAILKQGMQILAKEMLANAQKMHERGELSKRDLAAHKKQWSKSAIDKMMKQHQQYINRVMGLVKNSVLAQLNEPGKDPLAIIREQATKVKDSWVGDLVDSRMKTAAEASIDVDEKIAEKLGSAFVHSFYQSEAEEIIDKYQTSTMTELNGFFNQSLKTIMDECSASKFLKQNGAQLAETQALDAIMKGEVFDSNGHFLPNQGFSLDVRADFISQLGLGSLSPLEKYILSGLISSASIRGISENRPNTGAEDITYTGAEDITLLQANLSQLVQTHFCMYISPEKKKALFENVKAKAEEIKGLYKGPKIETPKAPVSMKTPLANVSEQGRLVNAIYAHLAIDKNVDLRGSSQEEEYTHYFDIEEIENSIYDFVDKMKDEALGRTSSLEGKAYVEQYFADLAKLAISKLNVPGLGVNAVIEQGYKDFCAEAKIQRVDYSNPETRRADIDRNGENRTKIEEATREIFDAALKEQPLSYKELKKINDNFLSGIKKSLKSKELINDISEAQFLIKAPNSKLDVSDAFNFVKEGKAFTSSGQLKEGLKMDVRATATRLGYLTPLENYILSSLIFKHNADFTDKNLFTGDESEGEYARKSYLNQAAQDNFYIMLSDKDKKSLLKEVKAAAKAIQALDKGLVAEAKEEQKIDMAPPNNPTTWQRLAMPSSITHTFSSTQSRTSITKPSAVQSPTSTWRSAMAEGRDSSEASKSNKEPTDTKRKTI